MKVWFVMWIGMLILWGCCGVREIEIILEGIVGVVGFMSEDWLEGCEVVVIIVRIVEDF